ncbi:hypothetical protein KFK09_001641 [Dendrobium nobile]|uniref:Uncharacterized protein n=1 Tax=Dendrobium nobile TaxID=94219 RepID=A0A8T3CBG3_DENNO|nr:hypothetical protein KFK09_001641 [Dendrobium nobile]
MFHFCVEKSLIFRDSKEEKLQLDGGEQDSASYIRVFPFALQDSSIHISHSSSRDLFLPLPLLYFMKHPTKAPAPCLDFSRIHKPSSWRLGLPLLSCD